MGGSNPPTPFPDPSPFQSGGVAQTGLFTELRRRLDEPDWSGWTDEEFEGYAFAAFRHQFQACPAYGAFCTRRGVTPESVAFWQDIPVVPATAFKHFDFVSGPADGGEVEAVFLTSGTTRGTEARGRHHVPSLDLYRASLAEPFRRALLPELSILPRTGSPGERSADGPGEGNGDRALFVSLIPSPGEAPSSSLSFMVGAAADRFARDVLWLVDGSGGWRPDEVGRVAASVDAAGRRGEPVLLLGTALSFVHLLEAATSEASGRGDGGFSPRVVADSLRALPETARVMETGGFKGARREISRDALYRGIEEVTGVDRNRIVNEYGMTELLSQLYEGDGVGGGPGSGPGAPNRFGAGDDVASAHRLHRPPPWLRVRALDPVDLKPLPDGRDGILAFFDLANLGSVCHVLTEDVGSIHEGSVHLRGRALGSEPRGCSRALDDLMTAARG